jgi:hypothetical protein
MWHGFHAKFYDDQFRHSSNIKVTTSTILEDAVLVSVMRGIYEVRR